MPPRTEGHILTVAGKVVNSYCSPPLKIPLLKVFSCPCSLCLLQPPPPAIQWLVYMGRMVWAPNSNIGKCWGAIAASRFSMRLMKALLYLWHHPASSFFLCLVLLLFFTSHVWIHGVLPDKFPVDKVVYQSWLARESNLWTLFIIHFYPNYILVKNKYVILN